MFACIMTGLTLISSSSSPKATTSSMPPATLTSGPPSSPPLASRVLPVCAILFVPASTNAAVSQLKLGSASSCMSTLLPTTPPPRMQPVLEPDLFSSDALAMRSVAGSSITQSWLEEIIGQHSFSPLIFAVLFLSSCPAIPAERNT